MTMITTCSLIIVHLCDINIVKDIKYGGIYPSKYKGGFHCQIILRASTGVNFNSFAHVKRNRGNV